MCELSIILKSDPNNPGKQEPILLDLACSEKNLNWIDLYNYLLNLKVQEKQFRQT